MNIFVVDPGYFHEGGHHRVLAELLTREAKRRGGGAIVLAHQLLPPAPGSGVNVLPVFTDNPYTVTTNHPLDFPAFHVRCNTRTHDVLRKVCKPAMFAPGDTIVVHTGFGTMLQGMHEWYRSLGRADLKVRVIVRFPPTFPATYSEEVAWSLLTSSLREWHGAPGDVRFFSDLPSLSRALQGRSGIAFSETPIAVNLDRAPDPVPAAPAAGRGLTWVFAGQSRAEKGANLLPDALEAVAAARPQDRFRLQWMETEDHPFTRRMRALGDRVEIVPRLLHGRDYFDFLASGDATLVAYDPVAYQHRTSHILIESLALGRPVVTTAGTWMEETLAGLPDGAGRLMPRFRADDLAEQMLALAADADRHLRVAAEVAPRVRTTHNERAFVDFLLA